jgi:hypothetical protein
MIFDGIYIDFTFNNYHSIWVPVKCEAKGNETKLTELSCALIVDFPMDRNKCLCSTSKDEDTDKKILRKHNLNEIRVLSFVYVNGSGSVSSRSPEILCEM